MDWLKIIADKKAEFQPMFDRMDKDRDIAFATNYETKGISGKKLKGIANVTLPEPKSFLAKCVARLSQVQRQTVVESEKMSDRQTTRIENFLDDVDHEADILLTGQGQKDEISHIAEQVCLRGPIAEQIITRVENDRYVPDIRMLDTRFFYYESDSSGVTWAAPVLRRSKWAIKKDYDIDIRGKTGLVMPCWDENEESIFIDNKFVKKNKNEYGFCPFVVQIPASGTSIQDEDYFKYRAESIFALLRNDSDESLFDEANFLASMLKTMTYDLQKPPLQLISKNGQIIDIEEYPGDPGDVISLPDGEFRLVPKRDVTNAARYYKQIVDLNKQIATYTVLDFGSTTFPLSAVAMTKLSENKNELLMHRLNAVAFLRRQRARMVIKQLPRSRKLYLGEEGHRRAYSSSDLTGEYTINYRFWTSTKEDIASDMAIANAARGIFSEDTIRRDIIKVKNPDGEAAKMDSEFLERENPIIRMYRQLHALIDQAEINDQKDVEARILLAKILNLIKRTKLDEEVPLSNEPNMGQPTPNSNPLIPLFANSGRQEEAEIE